MPIGAGNGQWVRVRNKAGADSFLAEKAMERERLTAARERGRYRRKRFMAAIRRGMHAIGRRVSNLVHRAPNG